MSAERSKRAAQADATADAFSDRQAQLRAERYVRVLDEATRIASKILEGASEAETDALERLRAVFA